MFVARQRIVKARKGQAPLVIEVGDEVPGFSAWPFASREAALQSGKVIDTADGDIPWTSSNVGMVLKRLHLQMVRQRAANAMGGEARLAAAETRFAPSSPQPTVSAAVVEDGLANFEVPAPVIEPVVSAHADIFDCATCGASFTSERGYKIHRSRQHKKR